MGLFKNKKTGEPSKFAEFVKNIGSKVLDINPLEILGSPNPFGALVSSLTKKADEGDDVSKQFLLELKQRKVEFEKDWELAVFSKEVEDKEDARAMYTKSKDFADKLAQRIMDYNLWYVLGLVVIDLILLIIVKHNGWNPEVALGIGATTGMIIQSLLNERKEVVGYYFGSSMGSKIKDGLGKAKDKLNKMLN